MSTIPRHTQNVLPPGGRRNRSPFAAGAPSAAAVAAAVDDSTESSPALADPAEQDGGATQAESVAPTDAAAPADAAPADLAGQGSGEEPSTAPTPVAPVVEATKPSPATKPAPVADAKPKQVLLKLPPQDKTRMTRTRTFTAPYTGIDSEQEFIRQAIAEKCERYEREYNSGKPYPPLASED